MTDNRAELIIALRDELSSGMAKINATLAQTRQEATGVGGAFQQGAAGANGLGTALEVAHGKASNLVAQFTALIGVSLSVAGGFDLVKKGIESISERNLAEIATAAMMLSRSGIEGIAEEKAAYGQYKAYVLSMYQELAAETERHFASGQEMIQTFDAFARKGIYAAKDEAGAVGVITDAVKLLHGGFTDQMTVMHEIQGVLEGHAGRYFRLAETLRGQIGPEWKEIIQSHIQDETLITFLAEQFKGLSVASADIQDNLKAQSTTFYTLMGQVGRGGLADMYADIVVSAKDLNQYLRSHKDDLITGIARGWEGVKDLAGGVLGFVSEIANIANKGIIVPITFTIGGAAKFLAGGAGPQGDFGFGALDTSVLELNLDAKLKQNQTLADQAARYKAQTYQKYLEDTTKPPSWKPPQTATGKGGGKGEEGALNSMQSLMDRLNQDISRFSEGSAAAVDAWYVKTVNDINKLVAKGADGSEALALAEKDAALKKQKVNDDFYQYIAKQSGNAYVEIEAQSNQWLQKVGGDVGQIMQIWEVKDRKDWEADVKNYTNRMELEKSFYDQAAALAVDQSAAIDLRREALNKEIEIHRAQLSLQLNQLVVSHQITADARDRYIADQALLDQQKKFNFEMENNKGMAGWAWGRGKEADQKSTIKDMMGGLESGFQNAFSTGLQGVLSHDKNTLQKIGSTMFQGLIGEINKGGITRTFDSLAKMLRPEAPSAGGAGTATAGGGTTTALGQAATGLQKASAGFNLNTAQFGLAAGGLVLSGIGIMANSQALVIAGTVLQVAGMAIQIYEALSAVTTEMTMGVAAGALIGSAVALDGAAEMLMMSAAFSFFHGGGVIAHSGWLVAHEGLNLDERRVIAQVGEGIIKRDTMAAYARAGISFDDLNSGRLPVVSMGGQGGGGTPISHDNKQVHFHIHEGAMPIMVPPGMTNRDAEALVRRQILPALEKVMGNRGLSLIS